MISPDVWLKIRVNDGSNFTEWEQSYVSDAQDKLPTKLVSLEMLPILRLTTEKAGAMLKLASKIDHTTDASLYMIEHVYRIANRQGF